ALRWRHLLLGHFPNTVVPLSDKTCPFLDRQISRLVSNFKRNLLIVISGGSEQIYAIVFSGRQSNGLSVRHDCIRFSSGREIETDSAEAYLSRQHLCGQRFSLRCALAIRRPIETAVGRTSQT